MKPFCIATTLILCIAVNSIGRTASTPIVVSDSLYSAEMQAQIDTLPADLKQQVDTANQQLIQYSATHTGPETLEYAKTLLNQMTDTALEDGDRLFGEFGDGPLSDSYFPIQTFGDRDYGLETDEERRRRCIRDHRENCRNEYNAEIFQSAAIGTGVFLGCGLISLGTGTVWCALGGFAVYGLGVAAARERREACNRKAEWACPQV